MVPPFRISVTLEAESFGFIGFLGIAPEHLWSKGQDSIVHLETGTC